MYEKRIGPRCLLLPIWGFLAYLELKRPLKVGGLSSYAYEPLGTVLQSLRSN